MTPLEYAEALCTANGFDFEERWQHFRDHGVIMLDQESIIMGEVHDRHAFVWLAFGPGCLQKFCRQVPLPIETVEFARGIRGRFETKSYNFNRLKEIAAMFGERKTPKPPKVYPAVPPPTERSSDVTDVANDQTLAQKKRKSLLKTVVAGETMSGTSYQSSFGQKSLLGS